MSASGPSSQSRTRFLIAVAVLTGAIILLLVTEFASMAAESGTTGASKASPALRAGTDS